MKIRRPRLLKLKRLKLISCGINWWNTPCVSVSSKQTETCTKVYSSVCGRRACSPGWNRWRLILSTGHCHRQTLCCARNRRRSEEHTSELQSRQYLVCRLLLE